MAVPAIKQRQCIKFILFAAFIATSTVLLIALKYLPENFLQKNRRLYDSNYGSIAFELAQWKTSAEFYRSCLLEKIDSNPGNSWLGLNKFARTCQNFPEEQKIARIKHKRIENLSDVKGIILESNSSPWRNYCTVVTLGVGGDILAELKIQRLQRKCQFFGADPVLASGKVYERIGKYYRVAVAAQTKTISARVRGSDGKYEWKTVKTLAIEEFLRRCVKKTRIDHLLIDIEGPEYQIFPLFSWGQVLDNSHFEICQISAEFHHPLQKFGVTKSYYEGMIRTFIESSPFLPIWEMKISKSRKNHKKGFYFNFQSDYCVRKYLM